MNEVVCNMVGDSLLLFNVHVEFLQVCGPLMMEVIPQLSLWLHELHRILINVMIVSFPRIY
jgi:hypothetical protein